ncbi:MAG: endonuclease domain-containing protein [Nocardioides sp.]
MAAQPALEHPHLDIRRPFTYAAAIASGLRPAQLRGKSFRRLFTGVYISADVAPLPIHRVQAALLIHPPGAFASHTSAGRVYDAPLPAGLANEHVSVFEHKDRRRRDGIRNHVVQRGVALARHRGCLISAPEQTFVELAELLTLVDLVVVGDYFVKQGWVTPERLVDYCAGPWGSAAAAKAAAYVRRDVESPMETRLRMLIVLAGLPEPQVNFKVLHPDGQVRYRFDLSWPELRLVVEYDGRQHRDDLVQWDHDVERGEWLDDDGWKHLPVFSWGIYRRPDKTLARVVKALRERGCRDLPPRLSDDWRPHFPVRPRAGQ